MICSIAERIRAEFDGVQLSELCWYENPLATTLRIGNLDKGARLGCPSVPSTSYTFGPMSMWTLETLLLYHLEVCLQPPDARGWASTIGFCTVRAPPRKLENGALGIFESARLKSADECSEGYCCRQILSQVLPPTSGNHVYEFDTSQQDVRAAKILTSSVAVALGGLIILSNAVIGGGSES